MTATAYPLAWPQGRPRSKKAERSQFRTSLNGALGNVRDSLRRFGEDTGRKVTDLVISSNVTLTDPKPKDAGVAAYFEWGGQPVCIAVDRYPKVEDNLQAIHHVLEAERTKMRHAGLPIVEATFNSYTALPPGPDTPLLSGQPWWRRLGLDAEPQALEEARAAYRAKVKSEHPDAGGDAAAFQAVNDAWREAQRVLG